MPESWQILLLHASHALGWATAKVPSFCTKHFHSQAGDDPACKQFEHIDTRSIQHPPYDHPGDVA